MLSTQQPNSSACTPRKGTCGDSSYLVAQHRWHGTASAAAPSPALQADDAGSEAAPEPSSNTAGEVEGGLGSASLPLLDKKAGIRDAGLIFAPGKSWIMGLLLVVVSGLVLAVTLLTAALG